MKTKTDRLEVRLSREHKELIERAAAASGQPISAFAIANLVERAREALARHEQTVLSHRDWQRFLEILEREEEPTLALRKAIRKRRGRP